MDRLLATFDALRSPGSSATRGRNRAPGSLRSPGSTAAVGGSLLLSSATTGGGDKPAGTSSVVNSKEPGIPVSHKMYGITRVEPDDPRCFGFIGQDKICLAQKGDCSVGRHRNERGVFDVGTILILKKPSVAFAEPTFPAKLKPELWSDFKDQRLSVSGWEEKLGSLSGFGDSGSITDMFTELEKEKDSVLSFKTPSRKNDPEADGELPAVEDDTVVYTKHVPAEDRNKPMFQDDLGRVVLALDDTLETTNKSLTLHKERSFGGLREVESLVTDISGMMETRFDDLATSIGQKSIPFDDELLASTLWGSVSRLAEVYRQKIETASLPKDLITSSGLKRELESLSQTLKGRWSRDIQASADCHDRTGLKELEAKSVDAFSRVASTLKDLLARMKVVESNGVFSRGGTWLNLYDDHSAGAPGDFELKQQMELLVARVASLETPKAPLSVSEVLEDKVALLEDKVQKLILDGDDTSIRFMSLGFKGLDDTIAFANAAGLFDYYGCFMDPLRLLAMMAPKGKGNEAIKTANEAKKINISNGMDAGAVMCLKAVRPVVIHDGDVIHSPGEGESPLNKLPTHSKWESGSDGWKHYLARELKTLNETVQRSIDRNLKADSPAAIKAKVIAELTLAKTVSFLLTLSEFVSKTYHDAHKKADFAADRSWSLAMRLLDRILADLYIPRAQLFDELDFDNKASVAGKMLYAVLQTHDRMEEFTKHDFRDHPSIASEFVKFLTSNSGSNTANLLEKRVKTLEDGAKVANEAKKKADVAANKASECSDKVTKLSNRLDKAETKIKTLEKNKKE